jgi:WD40 repeat protein
MPCYSSAQFYKDWRYGIDKDFIDANGEPVKYAPDGFRTWGSERYKLPFPKVPKEVSVNCDCSLIAIAVENDIYIYDTVKFEQVLVCKGHVFKIESLSFQPGSPKVLVSSNFDYQPLSPSEEPTIILWYLDEMQEHQMVESSVVASIASQATDGVEDNLMMASPRIEISAEERMSLTSAIEPVIEGISRRHAAANLRKICGRFTSSSKSQIFSPSGNYLIYMPGKHPRSNDCDKWDVRIYSMSTHEDLFTLGPLNGHTDTIMWTGYSPDETMIATVAWDQSMRIWDATNGQEKYKFATDSQNWTGSFSPNSKRFAGTCGDGTLYVYSLEDGSTLVKQNWHSSWKRALDWAPDSNVLAVGEGDGPKPGWFILYDVDRKEIKQERIFGTEAWRLKAKRKRSFGPFLEVSAIKFVDGGRKVVVLTCGDGGIETYDLESWEKWRFARPGIDPPFDEEPEEKEEDEEKKSTEEFVSMKQPKQRAVEMDFDNPLIHGGYRMTVWEDKKKGTIFYASMDGDAVRIWDIPMTKEDGA